MRRVQWCAFLALIPIFAGCFGSSTVSVSGKVTYKGALLKGGNVTFISTAGKYSPSTTIAVDGTYKIENCPVGPVKIVVETESLKPTMTGPKGKGSTAPPKYEPPAGVNPGNYTPPAGEDMSKRYMVIPREYADVDKNKLPYEVKSGEKTHDIVLD